MSDSLRDQLLKAGFSAPKKVHKAKSKNSQRTPVRSSKPPTAKTPAKSGRQPNPEEIARRKKIKAEIKVLIETNCLKQTSGDLPYSFVVGKKVRQIYLNKTTQDQLSNGTAVLTRLNGNTHVIPSTLVESIQQLNPDWVIMRNESTPKDNQADNAYADFKIPDDLMW